MKTRSWVALAAIAGVGMCGCTPSSYALKGARATDPQNWKSPVRSQPTLYQASQSYYYMRPSPNPAAQQVNRMAMGRQTAPLPARAAPSNNRMPNLTSAELHKIGEQIFQNEGSGNVDNLVHWNAGEDFASMGVGHFTWYPAGRRAVRGNTFPELLDYLQARGARLPGWLQQARHSGAPWRSRGELMQAKNTRQVMELQNLLSNTRELQTQFIVDRTRRAMPRVVNATTSNLRPQVVRNLNAVANTPGGWYALIDYVNFKGEGLNRTGGYNGHNWGLLQVLEEMRPTQPGQQALHEFADAAMRVLHRRVRNSPPQNNESRWLAGWNNRINTYRRVLV